MKMFKKTFVENHSSTDDSSTTMKIPTGGGHATQISFSSMTDSPSVLSDALDTPPMNKSFSQASEYYVAKKYENRPMNDSCKEEVNCVYVHEMKLTYDQITNYDFDAAKNDKLVALMCSSNTNKQKFGILSSVSFKKFLRSISPSGMRKSDFNKNFQQCASDKNDHVFLDTDSDDQNKPKNKKVVNLKKEFSLRSFTRKDKT
ncbi:hypothetical protein HELRODRAFT_189741 [Helobdella robusta]|uniref:Uncharacterized protein n=1 Tax=Helobdella robusta TaxID=6412 RepID=T1FRB8_HELRO|nr:hypothetical protein HELRODRAFT_189741 [Helobdella robusta]ESN91614.1 hypothetical protein HELRODRAFT_189741 [Helobdella robusta]